MFGIARIQRNLLFPRHLVQLPPHLPVVQGRERWWLSTDEGDVEAWLLPGHGISAEHAGPAVVFAHGNGELIDHWCYFLDRYRQLGISVILPEYRGYGRSAGKPSEHALVSDFCQVYARMRSDPRIDLTRLAYHGRSLGGGVVCALAKIHAPQALVLESTFTSVVDVARGMGIPGFFIHDRFESLPVVRDFAGPVLVLHGTRDTLIPPQHAERLAAANRRAELVFYEAGHNDLPPPRADYWPRIEATLRRAWGESGSRLSAQ
jgi:fermentation-respiration switch protein FrsA (DUF1100 family)